MKWLPANEKGRQRVVLAGLLLITCFLGSRNIRDESSVMLGGDMSRYVMNGVFIHDLIADGGVTSYEALVRYAERYYAKYPALSLGHHPPLPYLSVVPFFWIFGVSLLAARMAAIFWFILAVWGLFAVVRRMFNWQAAGWAAALFVTNVLVLRAGQYLLSEMPMTALMLWALFALLHFCDTHRPLHFLWFAVLVVASLYAKQLAALMLPVYAAVAVSRFGWRSLVRRRALVAMGIALVLIVPIVIMTVWLAPANVNIAVRNVTRLLSGTRRVPAWNSLEAIVSAHLTIPLAIAMVAGLIHLFVRKRSVAIVGLIWIVSTVGGSVIFTGATEPARYAFGALPAYAILAAGLAFDVRSMKLKAIAAMVLSAIVISQFWTVRNVHPSGAGGYDAAVRYVLARDARPAVLYDSSVDTGYFAFLMRQHDPEGRRIILRADKLVGAGSGDPEVDRRDLHQILRTFGVRWIVAEERTDGPQVLRTFYEEFLGPRFAERERIPVVSTAAQDLDLLIFEYLDAQPANYDAEVKISLPLGRRDFTVRLRDLVPAEPRRP